jgi:hypothetical protein
MTLQEISDDCVVAKVCSWFAHHSLKVLETQRSGSTVCTTMWVSKKQKQNRTLEDKVIPSNESNNNRMEISSQEESQEDEISSQSSSMSLTPSSPPHPSLTTPSTPLRFILPHSGGRVFVAGSSTRTRNPSLEPPTKRLRSHYEDQVEICFQHYTTLHHTT